MPNQTARLDSEQLRSAVSQLKQMTENGAEAIHITRTAVLTASPDENLRPAFFKQIASVFDAQKSLMDGQLENMQKLDRLAEEYIEQHAAAASGF
jgi:hypothetical protein